MNAAGPPCESGSSHSMASTKADGLGWSNGGAEEIRTPDPRVANAMLYQLSYRPI